MLGLQDNLVPLLERQNLCRIRSNSLPQTHFLKSCIREPVFFEYRPYAKAVISLMSLPQTETVRNPSAVWEGP